MRRLAAAALICAALGTGCTSHAATANVHLSVTPDRALIDKPVSVTVTGLRAGEHVTLSASATDYKKVAWHSSATFVASADGIVTTAARPISGSYTDHDPMGLFDRMVPAGGGSYDIDYVFNGNSYGISVSATVGGREVAHTEVQRLAPTTTGIRFRHYTVSSSGIDAELRLPRATSPRPAVLIFGGSEGGLDQTFTADLLAAEGYPTMALAYFGARGLPGQLHDIPLEYFVKALRILRRTPGVDPRHVVVWGISRGSEAALLLGAHFPRLVDGVVAAVPSSVINGAYRARGAAWTLQGRPLPYTPLSGFADPAVRNKASIIPVERIRGPLLLICGGQDRLWPSCAYSAQIVRRMARFGKRSQVTRLAYPTAGHGVGIMTPYVASINARLDSPFAYRGGTVAGDTLGRIDAWRHVLAMLAGLE